VGHRESSIFFKYPTNPSSVNEVRVSQKYFPADAGVHWKHLWHSQLAPLFRSITPCGDGPEEGCQLVAWIYQN